MDRLEFLVFISCFLALGLSQSNSPTTFLTVVDIEAPNAIELDGNVDEVILDCPFVTNISSRDVVVKWFYNGTTNLIYQWIPADDGKPYATGTLKSNIDTNYTATNDTMTKYRALKLMHLSPKLSGNYTCKVSIDFNEDMKTHQLTLFAPAASFDMVFYDDSDDVVCSVTMIAPKPEIQLLALGENDTLIDLPDDSIEEDLYEIQTTEFDYSFFNITNTLSLNATRVNASKFLCIVTIPGTDYTLQKHVRYNQDDDDDDGLIRMIENEENDEVVLIASEINRSDTDGIANLTKKDPNAGARKVYSAVLYGFALLISLLAIKW